jgi:hypothetical protein
LIYLFQEVISYCEMGATEVVVVQGLSVTTDDSDD